MIEEGLALLVQADAAVLAICPVGGFLGQLPKDTTGPSWTHTTVSNPSELILLGPEKINERRVQIDCYADDPDDCIALAAAIDTVLNGYRGTMTDADLTLVHGIFREDQRDFFDEHSRSFRRLIEYRIWFNQS